MNKFILNINGYEYKDFDQQDLEDSIQNMPGNDPGNDNFLILEPKEPIQNSIYMQTLYEDKVFDVEIRIVHSKELFSHYLKKISSIEEVKKIFLDYYLYKKIPNISEWEDITNTF